MGDDRESEMPEFENGTGVDLSAVELKIPSGGKDYGKLAGDTFTVRPPRVKEVEFLAAMSPNNYEEQLTKVLKSLIVSPVGLDPLDMTTGDRQFFHTWIRAQIDPIYRFDAICPKCRKTNKGYQLKIEDIPLVAVKGSYQPNMKLELPKSKKKIAVRLETGRDRVIVDRLVKQGMSEWVARKVMVINSIDGQTMTNEEKCRWLQGLPAGDDLFLLEYLKWQKHGPDFTACPFKCQECGEVSELQMPFRLDFYMPTIQSRTAIEDAIRGGDSGEDRGVSGDGGDRRDGVREVRLG